MAASRSWRCPLTAVLLFVGALSLAGPALTQEDLYGPQTPTDVAFVRAVNAAAEGGLGVRVADADLEAIPLAGATAYVAVPPGPVRLDLGGETLEVDVDLGAFVSVVAHRDGVWVIEDTPLRDASRGLLALYNLSGREALDLLVADGPPVAEGVAPGEQQTVPIAEAEMALQVRDGTGEVITLESRLYPRGVAHTVLAVDGPNGLVVGYVASRLDP